MEKAKSIQIKRRGRAIYAFVCGKCYTELTEDGRCLEPSHNVKVVKKNRHGRKCRAGACGR